MLIEEVSVGDQVLSYDIVLGTHVWSKVQRVIVGQAQQVLIVDGELELTESHPVWVDGTWRDAWDLRKNSEVIRLGGNVEQVRSVVPKSAATVVYDLSVDYPHNYFADGFLVHNKSMMISLESAWKYDPTIHRPEDLDRVIEAAHEPMVECLRDEDAGYRPHRIDSFVIEFQDGIASLIILTPTEIERQQRGSLTQSFAPTIVEHCVEQVFTKLAETNAYPPGLPARFYRFRLAGEGPRVDRVRELEVDTMVAGFVGQGPSLAQCLDQLAGQRSALKGALRDGSAITLDVNFRKPSDPASVVGLYEPGGAPYDGLKHYDRRALDDCVESAVHPAWFDGVPPRCETTIRSTYRFERKRDSWDTSWELLDVGPTEQQKRSHSCTEHRPGTIKLRRALEGKAQRNNRAPTPRRSRGKTLEKKCESRGYTNVWAYPGHTLRCGTSCDEVRECRFIGWSGRDMNLECGLYAQIEVGLNSHSSFVERTPFPSELPVRLRLVQQDGERWLTVRAAKTRDGYEEGEILFASGNGSTVTPKDQPGFFSPLAIIGESRPQGGHILFADDRQSTEIDHNADCHTPDGHYFIAVSQAREPRPNHAAKRFNFVVMSTKKSRNPRH
jgi:hypothetical protein